VEKKKEKGFWLWWAGGGGRNPAQPGAGARGGVSMPAQPRRTARNGAGARETTPFPRGPHVRESGRGRRRQRLTGRGEPAGRREKPGRRWARRRFSASDPVLGHRAGALA
jgi:hypothetical protein